MCSHHVISLLAKPDVFFTKKCSRYSSLKSKMCSARKFPKKYLTYYSSFQASAKCYVFCKNFEPSPLFLGFLAKIRMCSARKLLNILTSFIFSELPGKTAKLFYKTIYLLGIMSNLSSLATAKQIICRTPPLAASYYSLLNIYSF